jgi:hypothetical protein
MVGSYIVRPNMPLDGKHDINNMRRHCLLYTY